FMKVCYCGPVSLRLLTDLVEQGDSLPEGYVYPLGAYLVRALHKAGIEVSVVTCWKDIREPLHLRGEGIEIRALPRRAGLPLMFDAYGKERRLMVRAIQSSGADLVHSQWTYEFAHAGLDSGLPCLVTARDAPWEIARHTRSPYRIFRAIYSGQLLKRIRNLSVISPYLGERYHAMGYRGQAQVVPNGLAKGLFRDDISTGVGPRNGPRFLSVTGWNRRKNPKTLLQAFGALRRNRLEARLILVGKDMDRGGPAEAWARSNGLADGVEFMGVVDHGSVIGLMRDSADIFVHSTREESFCMTILEAMAQGLPVVALPGSGAVPWLLAEGRAGCLAGGVGWKDLTAAMESLLADPAGREQLASAGHARAREHFTMDAIAKAYISLYEHILNPSIPS
ncbi:MAG: glycosyltransferase family 4 protein, partial [Opitutales bacterium]